MSLYNIDESLSSIRETNFTFPVTDGSSIHLYLKKTHRNGSVSWSLEDVFTDKRQIGSDIPEEDEYKQVILEGVVDKEGSRFHFCDIINHSVVMESSVSKPKQKIKSHLEDLWRFCFPDETISILRTPHNSSVNASDFKITTIWDSEKAGHIAPCSNDKSVKYKVGINWKEWHRKCSAMKVQLLIHELTHLIYNHHRRSFFTTFAEGVKRLIDDTTYRKTVTSWFGSINWNHLKAYVLHNARQQSSELQVNAYDSRNAAVESVISEMESILDYSYDIGTKLYIYPVLSEIKQGLNEGDRPVEKIDIDEVHYEKSVSDLELHKYITTELAAKDSIGFSYTTDSIPHIDADNFIVENEWYIELVKRMAVSVTKKRGQNPDEVSTKVPCVRVS